MGLGGGRPPIKAAPLRSHLALSVTVSLKSRLCVAVAGQHRPATRCGAPVKGGFVIEFGGGCYQDTYPDVS